MAGVQKAALERVVKSDPEFALRLFSSLSERLRQPDEVIETRSRRIAILDPEALAGPSGLSVDGQLSI